MSEEVRTFLAEVWVRNRERNRRLFRQLRTTVGLLNAAGIEPVLLKGAAYWALAGRPAEHDRILTDLDIMVTAEEGPAAVAALRSAGFGLLEPPTPSPHTLAEFGRPEDVGIIDLHWRPPGPEALALEAAAAPGQLVGVAWDGVRARAPGPALQIFLLVLHDLFQDGGYWRGEFSLRHLLEIAALSRRPEGVDWTLLDRLAGTRLVRNVTDAQLFAAAAMCGALAPPTARRSWVRLQHARRRAQFGWPSLSGLFVQFSA
jgi:hypothetical protein